MCDLGVGTDRIRATRCGSVVRRSHRQVRVSYTPIVGAGTYAHDATCAVSCTGTGEFFMHGVVRHDGHADVAVYRA